MVKSRAELLIGSIDEFNKLYCMIDNADLLSKSLSYGSLRRNQSILIKRFRNMRKVIHRIHENLVYLRAEEIGILELPSDLKDKDQLFDKLLEDIKGNKKAN